LAVSGEPDGARNRRTDILGDTLFYALPQRLRIESVG
jgi:hypothetical protein